MSTQNWEYMLVSMAAYAPTDTTSAEDEAVAPLNRVGTQGWEAVAMTTNANGQDAVLMKRAVAKTRSSGGRV